jgi:hypothetical protein
MLCTLICSPAAKTLGGIVTVMAEALDVVTSLFEASAATRVYVVPVCALNVKVVAALASKPIVTVPDVPPPVIGLVTLTPSMSPDAGVANCKNIAALALVKRRTPP